MDASSSMLSRNSLSDTVTHRSLDPFPHGVNAIPLLQNTLIRVRVDGEETSKDKRKDTSSDSLTREPPKPTHRVAQIVGIQPYSSSSVGPGPSEHPPWILYVIMDSQGCSYKVCDLDLRKKHHGRVYLEYISNERITNKEFKKWFRDVHRGTFPGTVVKYDLENAKMRLHKFLQEAQPILDKMGFPMGNTRDDEPFKVSKPKASNFSSLFMEELQETKESPEVSLCSSSVPTEKNVVASLSKKSPAPLPAVSTSRGTQSHCTIDISYRTDSNSDSTESSLSPSFHSNSSISSLSFISSSSTSIPDSTSFAVLISEQNVDPSRTPSTGSSLQPSAPMGMDTHIRFRAVSTGQSVSSVRDVRDSMTSRWSSNERKTVMARQDELALVPVKPNDKIEKKKEELFSYFVKDPTQVKGGMGTLNRRISRLKDSRKEQPNGMDSSAKYVYLFPRYPRNIKDLNMLESLETNIKKYLERIDEELRERKLCCPVCQDKIPNRYLMPCRHSVCEDCCEKVKECPLCRRPFTIIIKPNELD